MPDKLIVKRRRFNKSVQFETLMVKRPTYVDQFVQCRCLAVETLPILRGKLDGHKIGDEIFYGKFKQTSNGLIWHNCGKDV